MTRNRAIRSVFTKDSLERLRKCRIEVRTIKGKKCNPAIVKEPLGFAFSKGVQSLHILYVVDSEGENPEIAAKEWVLEHVASYKGRRMMTKLLESLKRNAMVAVVIPKHEAWLCEGLGLRGCGASPENALTRFLGRQYTKDVLAKLAHDIDVAKLLRRGDFLTYVALLLEICKRCSK